MGENSSGIIICYTSSVLLHLETLGPVYVKGCTHELNSLLRGIK